MELIPLGLQPVNGQSCFLLRYGSDPYILDAGNSTDRPLNLQKLQYLPDNVELLISHYHRDHIGCLEELAAQKAVKILAIEQRNSPYKTTYSGYPQYVPCHYYEEYNGTSFLPSGHCEAASAVQIHDFLYSGDFHCHRSQSYRGLHISRQYTFLLVETSLISVVSGCNPLKLLERVKRKQFYYFNQDVIVSVEISHESKSQAITDAEFAKVLKKNQPYQFNNLHADFRDVVELVDSAFAKYVILTHCERLSAIYRGKRMLEKMFPAEFEVSEGRCECNAVAHQAQENRIKRTVIHGKIKKFAKRCEREGILLEKHSDYYQIGRNIFKKIEKRRILMLYCEEEEARVFRQIGRPKGKKEDDFWM